MIAKRMTINEVRARGHHALIRELGPQGYVEFIRQYRVGHGDFTAERAAASDALSMDEAIIRAGHIKRRDESSNAGRGQS